MMVQNINKHNLKELDQAFLEIIKLQTLCHDMSDALYKYSGMKLHQWKKDQGKVADMALEKYQTVFNNLPKDLK